MKLRSKAALAAVFLCVPTAALADEFFAVTPSGAAETLFADSPTVVIGKLSSKCIDVKWKVVSSSATELVCESPLNMGQAILGQMLMGNSYSTPPRRFFKFNAAEINGISRVQASGWMELQMAFGQVKRNEFTGPEFHNGAIMFMTSAGGKFPVGTTFPNHAVLGFDEEWVSVGKTQAPRIVKLTPGGAAERGGLLAGDIITRIAGERIKGPGNVLDATARAAKRESYEVEVLRNHKSMKVALARVYRPAWSEAVVALTVPPTAPTAASSPSVADEIAKLAKLKADGLLTEAEFQAQKMKVLGQ